MYTSKLIHYFDVDTSAVTSNTYVTTQSCQHNIHKTCWRRKYKKNNKINTTVVELLLYFLIPSPPSKNALFSEKPLLISKGSPSHSPNISF